MPAGLMFFGACVGLFMLFPKGFKYLVGTWIGFSAGVVAWTIAALMSTLFLAPWAFLVCIALGIIAGCVLAAKG